MICKKENNREYIIMEEPKETDAFALQMLLENELPGFVSCRRQLFNAKSQLYYDISAKRPLSDGALILRAEQMERLLQSMLCALQTVSSYFLDIEGISLQPDTIFEERGEWYFCYLFTDEGQFEDRLLSLCEFLLSKVDQNDEKAVVLVYRFYQAVKRREGNPESILQNILFCGREENPAFCRPASASRTAFSGYGRPEDTNLDAELGASCAGGVDTDEKKKRTEREALRGETGTETEEEGAKEKHTPDALALVAFSLLILGSAGYSIVFCLRQQIASLSVFLQFRQGLLCAVFFMLGGLGVGACFFSVGFIGIKKEQTRDMEEQEVFEIPPIDKI